MINCNIFSHSCGWNLSSKPIVLLHCAINRKALFWAPTWCIYSLTTQSACWTVDISSQRAFQQLQLILQNICSLSKVLIPLSLSSASVCSGLSSRWWNMHPTLQLELRTWLWNLRCLRGCLFYVLWVVGRGTWRPLIMGQVLSVSPENRTFFPVQQQLLFAVFSANL